MKHVMELCYNCRYINEEVLDVQISHESIDMMNNGDYTTAQSLANRPSNTIVRI